MKDLVKNKKTEEKHSVKSILKVEIELSEDQLSTQKLKQIRELMDVINTD
ncbi:hypothetical protein [Bacillus salipaludis]|uniref:Uncharacterized protein n=1 Tax=Bacillus salipaludis TaxID=2547811 RepID=A0ABW8RCA1_9BACI